MTTPMVTVTGLDDLERALAQAPDEIARAGRNAINDTLRIVQREFRATLSTKFDIRKKSFIDRQIKTGGELFATKERLMGRVVLQGPGGQASTLEKFERYVNPSQTKIARDGRLAVPAKDIRTGGGHVARKHYLVNFLPITTHGGSYTKLRKRKGQLVAGKTISARVQQVGQRGTFVIQLATGFEGLVRREGRASDSRLELLWIFRKSENIPTPLRFEQESTAIAGKWLPQKTVEAIEHALRRANLK